MQRGTFLTWFSSKSFCVSDIQTSSEAIIVKKRYSITTKALWVLFSKIISPQDQTERQRGQTHFDS
jgi:hypothetical protein